jgi:protein-S-isoprenylcysteine O-methyltransferase Ste14
MSEAQQNQATTLVIAQVVCCGAVTLGPYLEQVRVHPPILVQILFGLVFVLGLLIFFGSLITLGQSLTPNPIPKPTNILIINGLYSWVRHPIYLALILGAIGWTGFWFSWISGVAALILIGVLHKKARFEEQLLIKRYGATYINYMHRVNRFFPKLWD